LGFLTPQQSQHLLWEWNLWARRNQLAPTGAWFIWMLLMGRGAGKTRSGAEWIRHRVETGLSSRIALVAQTPADVRDVMVEGESGILRVCPPWNRPTYEPSKRKLTWPNGAFALAFSSYEPDRLRGPQFDTAWCDELASWYFTRETWDNLMFTLRLGEHPKVAVTTTPKPIKLVRDLVQRDDCIVVRGSTYENVEHLPPPFLRSILERYEGTSLGRQEIYADIMDEAEGALWNRAMLEQCRQPAPELTRIVVAIDPSGSSGDTSDEVGIIVAGSGVDGDFYILDDVSAVLSPNAWGRRAVEAMNSYNADRIIAEANFGGDMVEYVLRTIGQQMEQMVPYKAVRASRGKHQRAEPIAALYEQHRVHHVRTFPELEDQLCSWTPNSSDSPDRLDALVWALTELSTVSRPNIRFI
jgi:predicted phage terminase large subunit-like protein